VVGMPCDWHAEISGSTAPVNSYQQLDKSEARRLVSDLWPNAPEIAPTDDKLAKRLRLLASASRVADRERNSETKKRRRQERKDAAERAKL